MTEKHIVFEIGTMVTGAHKDFAGYTNYERFDDADEVSALLSNVNRHRVAGKRPTRLGKPGGHFDGSLDIVGEAGDNRYYFSLEAWSGTIFAPGEKPILPVGNDGAFIHNIKIWDIQDGMMVELASVPANDQLGLIVSFDFNLTAATNGPTAKAIEESGHKTAFKVPFIFNLIDKHVGAPPWAFDDHRYEPNHGIVEHLVAHNADDHHDDQHHDHDNPPAGNLKLFTHGGIHPDDMAKLFTHGGIHPDDASDGRTHGGIHPPGVASFVIAEL
jgi:hypothetical protein